jgi:cytochrome c peroxidase
MVRMLYVVLGCLVAGLLLAQEPATPPKETPSSKPSSSTPSKASKSTPATPPETKELRSSKPIPSKQDSAKKGSETEEQDADNNGPAPNGTAAAPLRTTVLRPAMNAEQRTEWATRLRAVYSQAAEKWPPPNLDRGIKLQELGLMPEPKHPEANPGTKEKIELGKILFFDPRISGSGQMSCSNCHDPDLHWADGRTTAIGNHRRVLKRNAPSIMNVGLNEKLFWDGRAGSLEEQAKQVLSNPDEMDSSEVLVVERIGQLPEYKDLFTAAFGDEKIDLDRIVAAIASFERTIVSGFSRFDSFMKGKHEALPDEAVIGLHLFRTEARCMNCHNGPNFSDNQFHDVGLSYYGRFYQDLGRYKVTSEAADVGRFKTPTLRNIANTAPYMHNGLFPLDGVLNMYNAGMPNIRRHPEQAEDKLFPTKSPHLVRLNLNKQDLDSLKAFLESLSEPKRRIAQPDLPGYPKRRPGTKFVDKPPADEVATPKAKVE